MDSRPVFERNIAALRKRSPGLVAQLESTVLEAVELVAGPRGDLVVRENGVLLGSAYDPKRDGERLAQQMAEAPADILVAVGFGHGEQIEAYCALNPATVIVYEPSPERLRAALSRLSITNLLATHRDLHFVADLDQLTLALNARYVAGLCLRVFPHPVVLRLAPEAVAAAVERTRRVKDAVDTRVATSVESVMAWAGITAGNGRRIAESADFGRLSGALRGKPAVVVAAGPSLDKQLPLLRAFRDQVVVVSIGQTLKALRQAGIEPDLVHVLESKDVSQQLTGAGDTRDLCLALTPDAHSSLYDVPVRALYTATMGSSPMGTWIARATGESRFTMGGGTVAQGAVGLAVMMGCDPILLIGQDLAFTDGRAYARGSAYEFVQVELADDGTCAFTGMNEKAGLIRDENRRIRRDRAGKGRIVWVEGWHEGERVPTWRAYASFIEQYRDIGQALARAGCRLINCTEGGARIPMVTHQTFRESLEQFATAPVDARRILLETYDEAPRRSLEDYRAAIGSARARLDDLERAVERARTFTQDVRERLPHLRGIQQQMEALRGIARCEKKVRAQLEGASWLDALVQPEIYAALSSHRRVENRETSIELCLDEARFLIEAASSAVERARRWFEIFEASFEEARVERAEPAPEEGGPRPPVASRSGGGATPAIPL